MNRFRRRCSVLLLVVLALACGRAGGMGERAVARTSVEMSGCAAVLEGRVCEITGSTREIRVLFLGPEVPAGRLRWTLAGELLPSTSEQVLGGRRFRVELPRSPNAPSSAFLTATDAQEEPLFRLSIQRATENVDLVRTQRLRTEGRIEEAQRALPPRHALDAALEGRAESLRARVELAAGHVEEAIDAFRRAQKIHRSDGRLSDEALDAMALSHTLLKHGARVSDARQALERAALAIESWDDGRAEIGYYRALIARASGDLRTATREIQASERLTTRLGLDGFRQSVRQVAAQILEELGELDMARAELAEIERALPIDASPCDRAQVSTNAGWLELMALEARPTIPRSGSTHAAFLERQAAIPSLWERSCPKPTEIANARTNLALAALWAGDLDRAATEVARTREAGPVPGFVAVWLLDIEGRIALARGKNRVAETVYEELATRSKAASSLGPLWRATVGRGLAREALGDYAAAELSYREAEAILDEQAAGVAADRGKAGFLAGRDRSARLLADLLVMRGRTGEALDAVRVARARALSATERLNRVGALDAAAHARWESGVTRYRQAREEIEAASANDWTLAADRLVVASEARQLTEGVARAALDDAFSVLQERASHKERPGAPGPGELLLAFQPSADGAWLRIYARNATTTVSHRIPAAAAASLSNAKAEDVSKVLLEPFSKEIDATRTLRVLTYGPMADVDIHALPWRGAPLLAHVSVVYPSDLPSIVRPGDGRERTPPERVIPRRALVVADTRGDLPNARRESESAVSLLASSFDTTSLVGGAALRGATLDALVRSDLFHFAGHATFESRGEWDGALEMAGGGALRVGDVLTLPRVPELVVLSGCETGRSRGLRVADVNLARAFLASGARVVIATTRPVGDELAGDLVGELYTKVTSANWDVAESLRAAEVAVARRAPETDWSAYRVFVP